MSETPKKRGPGRPRKTENANPNTQKSDPKSTVKKSTSTKSKKITESTGKTDSSQKTTRRSSKVKAEKNTNSPTKKSTSEVISKKRTEPRATSSISKSKTVKKPMEEKTAEKNSTADKKATRTATKSTGNSSNTKAASTKKQSARKPVKNISKQTQKESNRTDQQNKTSQVSSSKQPNSTKNNSPQRRNSSKNQTSKTDKKITSEKDLDSNKERVVSRKNQNKPRSNDQTKTTSANSDKVISNKDENQKNRAAQNSNTTKKKSSNSRNTNTQKPINKKTVRNPQIKENDEKESAPVKSKVNKQKQSSTRQVRAEAKKPNQNLKTSQPRSSNKTDNRNSKHNKPKQETQAEKNKNQHSNKNKQKQAGNRNTQTKANNNNSQKNSKSQQSTNKNNYQKTNESVENNRVIEEIKIKVEPLIEPKELNRKSLLSSLQRIDTFYKVTYEKFSSFLTRELFLDNHIRILVGVSGGIDSVVLLDLFANLSAEKKWDIQIAHLDHGLREESNDDVEFVRQLANNYNMDFHTEKQNISNYAKQKRLSVEEAGRRMRYQFFEKVGKRIKTNFIATAHNANDNAETFFLNLFRGAGLTGLSGIPRKRNLYKNVNVVRPLINWTRDQIEEYAKKRKLEWREDESNKDDKYDRNKIRNGVIPYIEQNFKRNIIPTVNRAASIINQADRFVFEKLGGGLHELVEISNKDYTAIKAHKLQLFDEFSKYELISMVLARYLYIYDATFKTVQDIQGLIFADPGSKIIINNQTTAYKDRDLIYFVVNEDTDQINMKIKASGSFDFRDQKIKFSRISKSYIEINEDPNIEYFDAENLADELLIRNIEEGDRFNPLGMSGNIKISDFLINNKIPLFQKNKILALCSGDDIVWIVGMRISDKYKVTEKSTKVIKAEILDN